MKRHRFCEGLGAAFACWVFRSELEPSAEACAVCGAASDDVDVAPEMRALLIDVPPRRVCRRCLGPRPQPNEHLDRLARRAFPDLAAIDLRAARRAFPDLAAIDTRAWRASDRGPPKRPWENENAAIVRALRPRGRGDAPPSFALACELPELPACPRCGEELGADGCGACTYEAVSDRRRHLAGGPRKDRR